MARPRRRDVRRPHRRGGAASSAVRAAAPPVHARAAVARSRARARRTGRLADDPGHGARRPTRPSGLPLPPALPARASGAARERDPASLPTTGAAACALPATSRSSEASAMTALRPTLLDGLARLPGRASRRSARRRRGARGRRRLVRHRAAARRSAWSASRAAARRRSGARSCGSIEPTRGPVKLRRATDLASLDRRRAQALRRGADIFQDPYASLNPRMTIGRIVGEPLRLHRPAPRRSGATRVVELLDGRACARASPTAIPHEFSGGQRQRIGDRARARVEPELVVCDEPVSALDVSVQAQIINLLPTCSASSG